MNYSFCIAKSTVVAIVRLLGILGFSIGSGASGHVMADGTGCPQLIGDLVWRMGRAVISSFK